MTPGRTPADPPVGAAQTTPIAPLTCMTAMARAAARVCSPPIATLPGGLGVHHLPRRRRQQLHRRRRDAQAGVHGRAHDLEAPAPSPRSSAPSSRPSSAPRRPAPTWPSDQPRSSASASISLRGREERASALGEGNRRRLADGHDAGRSPESGRRDPRRAAPRAARRPGTPTCRAPPTRRPSHAVRPRAAALTTCPTDAGWHSTSAHQVSPVSRTAHSSTRTISIAPPPTDFARSVTRRRRPTPARSRRCSGDRRRQSAPRGTPMSMPAAAAAWQRVEEPVVGQRPAEQAGGERPIDALLLVDLRVRSGRDRRRSGRARARRRAGPSPAPRCDTSRRCANSTARASPGRGCR